MKWQLNLLLMLANTLPILTVKRHVGFAICVTNLDLIQIGQNVQLSALVVQQNVLNLVKLGKNNVCSLLLVSLM